MRTTAVVTIVGMTVLGASIADERRDPQCQTVVSKKERAARLQGRDPRAMEHEGYPSDPNVMYQRAKEIGNMRDAWGAIIIVQRRDPRRADELWRDYWCSDVLPAFEDRPHIALESLRMAARQGVPSAMIRLSDVYDKGEFGQPIGQRLAEEWKSKHDAAKGLRN
ncbi:MAG: hypothetical protein EPO20_18390 [Betaproteobacteria bacterium]|nr:MAG: hypothetical protein EPO20_18390 [Betaproteobacteria bacterium]